MTQTQHTTSKTASLADIANVCGVTKATVSRVLNAKPGFTVRQELQEKIHKAAAQLNYRPNGMARSLRSNKTPIVMVLGFHASWMTSPEPPLYGRLLDTSTKALESMDAACMLDLATDDDLSPKWSSLIPDGALVIPPLTAPRIDKLTRDRIPFVLVNEKATGDVSCVYTDDHAGAGKAVEYLISLGHRRIAYMNQSHFESGLDYHSSLINRMQGYLDTMKLHGLEPIPGFDQAMDPEVYFQDVILRHHPTAVLIYKSSSLKCLRELCLANDIKIPEQMSLIGFDHISPKFTGEFEYTCIDVPMEKMGNEAARILGQKLSNPNYHEQKFLESKLLIRQSTCPVSD